MASPKKSAKFSIQTANQAVTQNPSPDKSPTKGRISTSFQFPSANLKENTDFRDDFRTAIAKSTKLPKLMWQPGILPTSTEKWCSRVLDRMNTVYQSCYTDKAFPLVEQLPENCKKNGKSITKTERQKSS